MIRNSILMDDFKNIVQLKFCISNLIYVYQIFFLLICEKLGPRLPNSQVPVPNYSTILIVIRIK